jgi:ABC-type sugar transport system substrate-binding protein
MKNAVHLRGMFVAATILGTLIGVSACGSSSASNSTGTTSAVGSGKKAPPKLTVGFVDAAATVGVNSQIFDVFQQGGTALGWKVIHENANNVPATALQDTQLLIAQHVNGIVFSSVPSSWVHAALLAAKAANIPTIDIAAPETPNTYSGQYTFKYTLASQRQLVNVMAKSVPRGSQVAAMVNPILLQYGSEQPTLIPTLKAAGYNVILKPVGLAANIDQLYQQASAAVVQAHPGIKAMVDDVGGVVNDDRLGLQSAGAKNVDLYGYSVDSESVQGLLAPNSPLKAVQWDDYDGTAAIALDQLLNHAATGAPLATALTTTGTKIYTLTNLPAQVKANPSGNVDPVPASITLAPYIAKWGKTYALNTTS